MSDPDLFCRYFSAFRDVKKKIAALSTQTNVKKMLYNNKQIHINSDLLEKLKLGIFFELLH